MLGYSITFIKFYEIVKVCIDILIPLSIILFMVINKQKVIPVVLAIRCFLFYLIFVALRIHNHTLSIGGVITAILGVAFIAVLLLYFFNFITINTTIVISIIVLGTIFIVSGSAKHVFDNISMMLSSAWSYTSFKFINIIHEIVFYLLYIFALLMLKEKQSMVVTHAINK